MFGWEHILLLVISVAAIAVATVLVAMKWGWNKKILYVCCGISVVSELSKILIFMMPSPEGYFLPPERLPFHLCSIQIIFIFMLTFSKSEKVKKVLVSLMYPTLIGGGIMALFIPTSSVNYGWWAPISFQYWIFHAMLIFLALCMIITKPIKFDMKSYGIALLFLVCAFVGAIYMNSILGGYEANVNFFYVARPPLEGLPVLNMDLGWYFYVFNLSWLAVLLVTIAYIPVFVRFIREKRAKSNPKTIESAQEKS